MTKNNTTKKKTAFPKPTIIISKCIEYDHCRYNGQMIQNELVKKLQKHVNFVPVCPEVEIGLGVPRNPVRLVFTNHRLQLIQPSTDTNHTQSMYDFSSSFLEQHESIDGFLLKYKSHLLSCMKATPKRSSMINVIEHMFGFFKTTLSFDEKQFFFDSITLYKEERIPLSSLIMIIKTWALKEKLDYLLQQSILQPYPKELLELSDSGKILNL